jgi:ceramide glucosyltransferase
MASVLQVILFVASTVGVAFSVLAILLLRESRRQSKATRIAHLSLPPVSVFKPLKGVDEDLERNLRTFFRLDYSEFELLFGVEDSNDPAISIVKKLCREFPRCNARLVVDSSRIGHNPKVNNLSNLSRLASHNHWVISDSNVRVDSDYLTDLIAHMQSPSVGLVTSVIMGVRGKSLGARLENLHLNTLILGATLVVNRLSNIPVSIGKSMLLRRETVGQLGGFETFANYLLEDALLGQRIRALGLDTKTTIRPVQNVNSNISVSKFVGRHFRWGVGRFWLNPSSYLGEILSNSVFVALVGVLIDPTPVTIAVAATVIVTEHSEVLQARWSILCFRSKT